MRKHAKILQIFVDLLVSCCRPYLLKCLTRLINQFKMSGKCLSLIVLIYCIHQIHCDNDLKPGEVRMGSYGYKCISDCEMKDGTNYYWCDAAHPTRHYKGDYYWDYCSKDEGKDYQGTSCYIEHACGNHGYKYKWCYLDEQKSDWGYCGYKVQGNRT